ncbi:MAG: class I SAM-dependent methyltransferase [Chloroflexi bacterium]|nr:class I SAM-dependent methyltransferase [Chloroflexota bacterium]
MDYRKPKVFGENWSPSRYAVLPYFAAEREVFTAEQRILDLGCASGWNMSRFLQYGLPKSNLYGLDVVPERVQLATQFGHIMLGSGLELPLPDGALDVIYIQHVLHHIGDVDRALQEVHRCLRPNGTLFLIETTEDNPLIRWGGGSIPNGWGMRLTPPSALQACKKVCGHMASACNRPSNTASSSGSGKFCPTNSLSSRN